MLFRSQCPRRSNSLSTTSSSTFANSHAKRLRAYCLYRRRLLGEIARVAARTVTAAICTLTGERERAVGIVACLQTHGSRANGFQ